jgi:hypothetical protein
MITLYHKTECDTSRTRRGSGVSAPTDMRLCHFNRCPETIRSLLAVSDHDRIDPSVRCASARSLWIALSITNHRSKKADFSDSAMLQMFERLDQEWTGKLAGAMVPAQPLLDCDFGNGAAENGKSPAQLRERALVALGV